MKGNSRCRNAGFRSSEAKNRVTREREREEESAQVSTLMLTRGGSERRAMDVMDISTAASTR